MYKLWDRKEYEIFIKDFFHIDPFQNFVAVSIVYYPCFVQNFIRSIDFSTK